MEAGTKRWKEGQTIHFLFVGGTDEERELVKEISSQWTRYANLNFEFHTTDQTNIFGNSKINYQIVFSTGKNNSHIGENGSKMELTLEGESFEVKRRFILHEFGHMLGFEHEHQRADDPDRSTKFTRETALNYCEKVLKYNEERCEVGVIQNVVEVDYATKFDADSIMHYNLTDKFHDNEVVINFDLGDKFENKKRFSLSFLDKVAAMELYPGRVVGMEELVFMHEQDEEEEKQRLEKSKSFGRCAIFRTYKHDNPETEKNEAQSCYWKYGRINGDNIPGESSYCNAELDMNATIKKMISSEACSLNDEDYKEFYKNLTSRIFSLNYGFCKIVPPLHQSNTNHYCLDSYGIVSIENDSIEGVIPCFKDILNAVKEAQESLYCKTPK